jgi:hypothetical protein
VIILGLDAAAVHIMSRRYFGNYLNRGKASDIGCCELTRAEVDMAIEVWVSRREVCVLDNTD